jgi:hypothetical protein
MFGEEHRKNQKLKQARENRFKRSLETISTSRTPTLRQSTLTNGLKRMRFASGTAPNPKREAALALPSFKDLFGDENGN